MTILVLYLLAIMSAFALSVLVLKFLQIDRIGLWLTERDLDVWGGLWLVSAIGFIVIVLTVPVTSDILVPFGIYRLLLGLGLSAVIYACAQIENDRLTFATILLSSIAVVGVVPPADFLISQALPFWADRAIATLCLTAFSYGLMLLAGLIGILELQIVAICLGLCVTAYLGGIPLYLGLMAGFYAGVWLAYRQVNAYSQTPLLSDSSCLSIGFLTGFLLLQGCAEFSAPSMLILSMYVWAECLWVFVNRYILGHREIELYENTGYYAVFARGIEAPMVMFGLFKILLINIFLSWLQLYSPNVYSLPVFALAISLWFLYVMYRTPEKLAEQKKAEEEQVEKKANKD